MHQENVLFRGPVHQLKLSLAGIGNQFWCSDRKKQKPQKLLKFWP